MSFRRYSVLAAGLLLSVSAGAISAQAADVMAPATDLWTGFYVGAQAGYLQATGSDTDLCVKENGTTLGCIGRDDGFDFGDNNADGVTVGGYLGYNYQIDSIVLGLEGDFNWDNAEGSSSNMYIFGPYGGYSTSADWDASVRARLGVVVDERALLYVTGGPSWINVGVDADFCGIVKAESGSNVNCGDSSTEFGWQLGAGGEFMVTDHLSLKAEYLHGWYGDITANVLSGNDGPDRISYVAKENLQTNVVRAGIAYHFGGL